MLGPVTRKRGEDRAALPQKKRRRRQAGRETLVGTAATSASPGRILLSRMGGCTGLGSRCLSVVPAQISISN